MQRSYSLKIEVPKEFKEYLQICNHIFNEYVDWCFINKTYNKNKAHKELYQELRKKYPKIPSAIIQSIRDMALKNVKALKFKIKPQKKPLSSIVYNKSTISLRGNLLTFAWSEKRIKQIIEIPNFFKEKYKNWKFQAAIIGYDKFKKYFKANLIFKTDEIIKQKLNKNIVGIDRGLYNIVTLSDNQIYTAKEIRKQKRKFLYTKKQIQAKGTCSAKRKLKLRSGREKRFSLNENHKISKWLVNMPYDIFVLEDLKGITKKNKGRKINRWLSNWTFYQLEQLITYKAEELGKQIVKVDARYTSQRCSNCNLIEKSNRNKSHYKCKKCNYYEHADINAAKNIKNLYTFSIIEKSMEQAVANQPIVSINTLDTNHKINGNWRPV